jgi:hypothetical protein
MPVRLNTASGGSVTLDPANTASNFTVTVPAVSGTMITTASTFAGTGPAFSAYLSSAQTLSSMTATKIQFNTEEFDTASCYNNTSTYRFTPNVAGYYQVNSQVQVGSTYTNMTIWLYKNGTDYKAGYFGLSGASNVVAGSQVNALVYLNGSTDYIEIYAAVQNGQGLNIASTFNYFQAFLARAA